MIKKDLKLWVKVGKNSLKLRELMAEHLESMGIDGGHKDGGLRHNEKIWNSVFIDGKHDDVGCKFGREPKGKEISVAEFFNLTEADLKEPKKIPCYMELSPADEGRHIDLTPDQIDRVIEILNEAVS